MPYLWVLVKQVYPSLDILNVSQNWENLSKLGFVLSFTSMLKVPMIITLSYLLSYFLLRRLDRSPKKVSMFELHEGLCALKIALLLF